MPSLLICFLDLICSQSHRIKRGEEKYGIEITRQPYPWDRPMFDHPKFFKKSLSKLQTPLRTEILTKDERNPVKRAEFEHVRKLVSSFFSSDSTTSKKHAQWMSIQKIIVLRNEKLENAFQQKYNQFLERMHFHATAPENRKPKKKSAVAPESGTEDQWNEHQSQIMRTFQSYTGRLSGNEKINLILGWQGNSQEVNMKIAEGGHLTTDMKRERGITLTDAGYFGKGTPSPSPHPLVQNLLNFSLPAFLAPKRIVFGSTKF